MLLCLSTPGLFGLKYLWDACAFAKHHRDISAGQSAAARRADFKAKLNSDLDLHAAWAHKLVRDTPPADVSPADKLASIEMERTKWGSIWQADNKSAPPLPTAPFSLPSADMFGMDSYGGLEVTDARYCAARYPERKALGADLWESWLLSVLPICLLQQLVIWMRRCQHLLR